MADHLRKNWLKILSRSYKYKNISIYDYNYTSLINCSNIKEVIPPAKGIFRETYLVLLPIIMILGILGNLIGIYTFWGLKPWKNYHHKTLVQATSDTGEIKKRNANSRANHFDQMSENDKIHNMIYRRHHNSLNGRNPKTIFISHIFKSIWRVTLCKNMQRATIPEYLTGLLFVINAINCIFMLFYPLLDYYGEYKNKPFWFSYTWNFYIVYIHFPLAKTFMTFSYFIYITMTSVQIVAIIKPHSFKQICNKRNIRICLLICFCYSLIWYVPAAWWFVIRKHKVCAIPPQKMAKTLYAKSDNITPKSVIINSYTDNYQKTLASLYYMYYHYKYPKMYTSPFRRYTGRFIEKNWIAYGIARELFTRIFPFLAILFLRIGVIRKKKKILDWKKELTVTSVAGVSSTMEPPEKLPNQYSLNYKDKIKRIVKNKINIMKDTRESKKATNSSCTDYSNNKEEGLVNKDIAGNAHSIHNPNPNIYSLPNPTDQKNIPTSTMIILEEREREHKTNIIMLVILMLEFVIFLLPVSVFMMIFDFYLEDLQEKSVDFAFAICNLLEYLYVSLTFYLNLIFNRGFRQNYVDICK
ncbi:unnamed protein product [Gordionus sp. m RMFG-2023]